MKKIKLISALLMGTLAGINNLEALHFLKEKYITKKELDLKLETGNRKYSYFFNSDGQLKQIFKGGIKPILYELNHDENEYSWIENKNIFTIPRNIKYSQETHEMIPLPDENGQLQQLLFYKKVNSKDIFPEKLHLFNLNSKEEEINLPKVVWKTYCTADVPSQLIPLTNKGGELEKIFQVGHGDWKLFNKEKENWVVSVVSKEENNNRRSSFVPFSDENGQLKELFKFCYNTNKIYLSSSDENNNNSWKTECLEEIGEVWRARPSANKEGKLRQILIEELKGIFLWEKIGAKWVKHRLKGENFDINQMNLSLSADKCGRLREFIACQKRSNIKYLFTIKERYSKKSVTLAIIISLLLIGGMAYLFPKINKKLKERKRSQKKKLPSRSRSSSKL